MEAVFVKFRRRDEGVVAMREALGFVLALAGLAGVLGAQSPADFALRLEPAGTTGALVVGSWTIDGVQGWSYGVCHDPEHASLGDCVGGSYPVTEVCGGACPRLACPTDLRTIKNGAPPDFNTVNVYANGVVQGVVLDFLQAQTLPMTTRMELLRMEYDLRAPWLNLEFCATLGTPTIDVVFVVGGQSFVPAVQEKLGRPYPDMTLRLAVLTEQGKEAVEVLLDTPPKESANGFSFGLAHDAAGVKVADVVPGAAVAAAGGADYWRATVIEGRGATVGCVLDLEPEGGVFRVLPAFTLGQQIAVAHFALADGAGEAATTVGFSGALGEPPVEILVDVAREPVALSRGCGGGERLLQAARGGLHPRRCQPGREGQCGRRGGYSAGALRRRHEARHDRGLPSVGGCQRRRPAHRERRHLRTGVSLSGRPPDSGAFRRLRTGARGERPGLRAVPVPLRRGGGRTVRITRLRRSVPAEDSP